MTAKPTEIAPLSKFFVGCLSSGMKGSAKKFLLRLTSCPPTALELFMEHKHVWIKHLGGITHSEGCRFVLCNLLPNLPPAAIDAALARLLLETAFASLAQCATTSWSEGDVDCVLERVPQSIWPELHDFLLEQLWASKHHRLTFVLQRQLINLSTESDEVRVKLLDACQQQLIDVQSTEEVHEEGEGEVFLQAWCQSLSELVHQLQMKT